MSQTNRNFQIGNLTYLILKFQISDFKIIDSKISGAEFEQLMEARP